MESIERQAVRILATHRIKTGIQDGRVHCECDWVADRGRAPSFYEPHQMHQIEELAKAGLLVKRRRKVDG
jgi:hypothetical protein